MPKQPKDGKPSVQEIESFIAHCNGCDGFIKAGISGLLISSGVQWLCESAGCYWLIDVVDSVMRLPKVRKEGFVVVTLKVNYLNIGVVTLTDGGKNGRKEEVLYRQVIEYTDFPLEEIMFYLIDGMLMFPAER